MPDSVDPWTAANSPWNPSEDPMNRWNKGQIPVVPATSDNPFLPAPNPLAVPAYSGPTVSPKEAVTILGHAAAGDFFINLIVVGILWEIWVCLYPLAALAGLVTFFYAYPFLVNLLKLPSMVGNHFMLLGVGFVAAAVVLWNVSRFDHVLAKNDAYRLARHLVRLPLLGLAAILLIERAHGVRYTLAWPVVSRVLSIPQYLAIVIGTMVVGHFALWNWTWGREFWHERLMGARLRKRGT